MSHNHTLYIFETLHSETPPTVPVDIRDAMKAAIDRIKETELMDREDVEDLLIYFGKKVWPYREAFQVFLREHAATLGEKVFEQKLSRPLRKRYELFQTAGGTYEDLRSGSPAQFFSADERQELCVAVVDTEHEMRAYTTQAILGAENARYYKTVDGFKDKLQEIDMYLAGLKAMAEKEKEKHPELSQSILRQVRDFEYGLCLLGPKTELHAVCNAMDDFKGKKEMRKVMFAG